MATRARHLWEPMAWTEPTYPRDEVDWAGEILVHADPTDLSAIRDLDHARQVANNWRSAHSWPLNTFQMTLRDRTKKLHRKAVVGQRLKRMRSIKAKLERLDWLSLTAMQDIGGCRAVCGSIDESARLDRIYQENDRNVASEMDKRDDYVGNPKNDGYRSVHYVYRYVPTKEHLEPYRGLKIEIQLRSHLQHVWATATETVSTFTHQSLKTGRGEPEWFRFFALVSNAVAMHEECPQVPDTPDTMDDVVQEVRDYEARLDVRTRLRAWQTTTEFVAADIPRGRWYLLALDTEKKQVQLEAFPTQADASDAYGQIEKTQGSNGELDVVMVSSDSIASLKTIFPNYHVDMDAFLGMLEALLAGNM